MSKSKVFPVATVFLSLLLFMGTISVSGVNAAASSSLSVSGTREVDSVLTVNISISGTDGPYNGVSGTFNYDSSYLRLDSISKGNFSSDQWIYSIAYASFSAAQGTIPSGTTVVSAKFTCLKAGTTTISLSDFEVDGSYSSASKSVTITTPVPKSSNANLSSLKVSPGSFSPSFSASTTSYSMSVGESVSKVTVTAAAADSKATVSLNGVQNNIKPGLNTVKITVKAEDGTTKVYSLKVTRAQGPTGTPTPTPEPLPLMEYLDEEWMILPIDEDTVIPEGFSASTALYKDVQIPVVKEDSVGSVSGNLILVLLVTNTGSEYFVYDPVSQSAYPFVFISQDARSLRLLPVSDLLLVPAGYEAFEYEYEGEVIVAYRLISNPDSQQILLYLMNDGGEGAFYYFDTEEKMLMPYAGEIVILDPTPTPTPTIEPEGTTETEIQSATDTPESNEDISKTQSLLESLKDFKNPFTIIFYLVCLVALVLLAAVIALLLNRNLDNYDDEEYPDDMDPDDFPPLEGVEKKDYYQNFEDLQEPDRDEVFSENVTPEASTLDFPPIARIPVESAPVASETPIMGVRAIRFENIPELSSGELELSEKKGNVADSIEDDVSGNERVPVRLKQELDAEKLAREKAALHENSHIDSMNKVLDEKRPDEKLTEINPTEIESDVLKENVVDQTEIDKSQPDILDDPDFE